MQKPHGHASKTEHECPIAFSLLTYICDKEISPAPEIAIFGVTPVGMTISGAQSDAVTVSSLLSRHLILF